MSSSDIATYNELLQQKNAILYELRIIDEKIQECEKIIHKTCKHERERDYSVVGERSTYYCRKCKLYL